jgi:cytochrome c
MLDVASVGPTYTEIAERYQGDSKAPAMLAEKIINGGGGNWGDVVMAAHPQLTQGEAEQMVEYILSVAGAPAPESMPLQGSYTFLEHKGSNEAGTYTFIATYTDEGGEEIGPLTVRDVVSMRSPIIPAWAFDASDGAQSMTVPDDAPGDMGGQQIILGMHGAVVTYADIDLRGISAITGTFVVAPTFTTGGTVDVYLDSVDGTLLGTMEVEQGLVDFGPTEGTVAFDAIDGTHDLVFVYKNEAEDGLVCIGVSLEFKTSLAG